jgi:hypothetical protein
MGTHGRWGSGASVSHNAADSLLVNDAALDDGRHGVMLLNFSVACGGVLLTKARWRAPQRDIGLALG